MTPLSSMAPSFKSMGRNSMIPRITGKELIEPMADMTASVAVSSLTSPHLASTMQSIIRDGLPSLRKKYVVSAATVLMDAVSSSQIGSRVPDTMGKKRFLIQYLKNGLKMACSVITTSGLLNMLAKLLEDWTKEENTSVTTQCTPSDNKILKIVSSLCLNIVIKKRL